MLYTLHSVWLCPGTCSTLFGAVQRTAFIVAPHSMRWTVKRTHNRCIKVSSTLANLIYVNERCAAVSTHFYRLHYRCWRRHVRFVSLTVIIIAAAIACLVICCIDVSFIILIIGIKLFIITCIIVDIGICSIAKLTTASITTIVDIVLTIIINIVHAIYGVKILISILNIVHIIVYATNTKNAIRCAFRPVDCSSTKSTFTAIRHVLLTTHICLVQIRCITFKSEVVQCSK